MSRRVGVIPILLLCFGIASPVEAGLPPPVRLALMFERPLWATRVEPAPRPPGHIVIEWSRHGSA